MFYLIKNYRDILLLISLLFVAYGVFRILGARSVALVKDVVSSYHIVKGRSGLYLLILLVFILNSFMFPLRAQQSARAEISLNYTKASQGLNPNGTRYNPAGILDIGILERAVQKGALQDITAGSLKRAMSVAPKVQGNSYDESGYFISTQFVLSYNANESTAFFDGETLLALTAEAYKEWFIHEYSDNVSALDMGFADIAQEDYLDICEYLKKRGDLISAYMTSMASAEPAFQSASTGETFQSIASQASNVSNLMVEKLQAYLLENGISKQMDFYRSRLGFQNVFKQFDALKAGHANQNNLAAISMYEDDMARIVLVPTYDTNYQFYMSQTRIGIDDFAKRAESSAGDQTKINNEISWNNHVIDCLSASSFPGGEDEKAEQLVLQIENELDKLAAKARTLVEEYSASQANKYITITVASVESQALHIAANVLLYTLVFAVSVHSAMFARAVNIRCKQQLPKYKTLGTENQAEEKRPEGWAGAK